MKIRTIKETDGRTMSEVRIDIAGKGGAAGEHCIEQLICLIQEIKMQKTEQDVREHFCALVGYCGCCIDAGFIERSSADELMDMVRIMAANEMNRAEREGML